MDQPGHRSAPDQVISGEASSTSVLHRRPPGAGETSSRGERRVGRRHDPARLRARRSRRGDALMYRTELDRRSSWRGNGKADDPVIRQKLACATRSRDHAVFGCGPCRRSCRQRARGRKDRSSDYWSEYHAGATELAMTIMGPAGWCRPGEHRAVRPDRRPGAPNSTASWEKSSSMPGPARSTRERHRSRATSLRDGARPSQGTSGLRRAALAVLRHPALWATGVTQLSCSRHTGGGGGGRGAAP